MKKILVPIDFSADSVNAFEFAIMLANTIGANVTMMNVKKTKTFEVPFYFKDFDLSIGKSLDDFFQILFEKYKNTVNNVLDYKIRSGNIYKEITNQAKYDDAFMIIMGTHGVSGFEELWIGSNAYRVMSNSPCPVITVRNGFPTRVFKNIVMPIDLSKESRHKVPFVAELARFCDSTVHIVGVSETSVPDIMSKISIYCQQVEEYFIDKDIPCVKQIISGASITDLTIEYAKKVDAELIAIMTEQLHHNPFWIGPYAQQMVNHSPIPVLSISKNH